MHVFVVIKGIRMTWMTQANDVAPNDPSLDSCHVKCGPHPFLSDIFNYHQRTSKSFLLTESSSLRIKTQSLEFTCFRADVLLQIWKQTFMAFSSVNEAYPHLEMGHQPPRKLTLQGTKFDFFEETWNLQENDLPGSVEHGTLEISTKPGYGVHGQSLDRFTFMLQSHCWKLIVGINPVTKRTSKTMILHRHLHKNSFSLYVPSNFQYMNLTMALAFFVFQQEITEAYGCPSTSQPAGATSDSQAQPCFSS